jgi:hypothetical protein
VTEAPNPLEERFTEAANSGIIKESTHPNKNNQRLYDYVQLNGAKELEVVFDPRCATET